MSAEPTLGFGDGIRYTLALCGAALDGEPVLRNHLLRLIERADRHGHVPAFIVPVGGAVPVPWRAEYDRQHERFCAGGLFVPNGKSPRGRPEKHYETAATWPAPAAPDAEAAS